MTSGPRQPDPRSAEQRAEEMMERLGRDVSRMVIRFAGRAREELEDLMAEARSLKERASPDVGGQPAGKSEDPPGAAPDGPFEPVTAERAQHPPASPGPRSTR